MGDIRQYTARQLAPDDLSALGLAELPETEEELAAAWTATVKRLHGTGADMDRVKQARNRLRLIVERDTAHRVNPNRDSTCLSCGGSGRIGIGFGRECPSCKGTGQTT